jgi:hypothetical protein
VAVGAWYPAGVRDCLKPQNLPEDLQEWFLLDAHVRLLSQRFAASILALEEQEEELRVTRPPFFHPKFRQLAITEEHRVAGAKLNAMADAARVEEARSKVEHVLIAKLSKLILVLDPESAVDASEILDDTRRYARMHWLDEAQNDQTFAYIVEQLKKLEAPPPETPVVSIVYGQDEHPKAIPANDPWANAAD